MVETVEHHDVIVVGGGIAGSALTATLARGGLDVLLLEASETYPDRVRGEAMVPWGVREARDLGLLDGVLAAGGQYERLFVGYDETRPPAAAEAAAFKLEALIPGVPGLLDIAHPQHCQALLDAAVAAGARARRGIELDAVEAGDAPKVRFRVGDQAAVAHARIIVGADGRTSKTREALGVSLAIDRPRTLLCGMLVDRAGDWADDVVTNGTEGDLHFFVFPLAGNQARIYGFWSLEQRQRFSGERGPEALLAAYRLACCPKARAIAEGRPAGPLVTFLNNESTADAPFVPGAVLIGDAAGWTDPILGTGLSSAYRDARLVSEVLLGGGDWSPAAFAGYAAERNERHRRLKLVSEVQTALSCQFDAAGRARRLRNRERAATDRRYVALTLAYMRGPETLPDEVFTPEHRAFVLGDA